MSGHPAYAWGNPPTLRHSSFPQRASHPAGGPIPKHTWGCAPRPPNAQAAAGYERCKHRPYGTADTFSRCLRRILFGFCRPIAESYAAKTMGRTSNYLDRRPLPRHGGGERGCEAERRQWRMQRGGAPAAVEKNEQASSAKIFSGTARRRGQIRCGYLWSASVRSTDLDFSPQKNLNPYPAQLSVKGVCKGESLVPLCPVLLPFAGAKGRPPRRAVLTMPLQKAPRRRRRLQIGPPPQATTGHNKNCPKSTQKRKEGPL